MARHQGRTALYRLFDRDDRLLYIGIATHPAARWRQHAADKPWWPDVVTREVEWFPTRGEAEIAECAAIGKHRPPGNLDHGVKPTTYITARCAEDGPGDVLLGLVEDYECAVKELAGVRDATAAIREDLEREALSVIRGGWSPYKLAKYLPWQEAHVRKLARAAGIEPTERYKERAAALRKAPAPPAPEET